MIFEGGGGNKNQRQQAEFFPLLTLLPKKSFVLGQCPGLTGFKKANYKCIKQKIYTQLLQGINVKKNQPIFQSISQSISQSINF